MPSTGGWGNSFSLLEGFRYAASLAIQLKSKLVSPPTTPASTASSIAHIYIVTMHHAPLRITITYSLEPTQWLVSMRCHTQVYLVEEDVFVAADFFQFHRQVPRSVQNCCVLYVLLE